MSDPRGLAPVSVLQAWGERVVARAVPVRRVVMPLAAVLAVVLVATLDGTPWRVATVVGGACFVVVRLVIEVRLQREGRFDILALVQGTFVLGATIMVVTGGLLSPLAVMVPVAIFITNIAGSDARHRRFLAVQIGVVAALTVAQCAGLEVLPAGLWGLASPSWTVYALSGGLLLGVSGGILKISSLWRRGVLEVERDAIVARDATRLAHEQHAREMSDLMAEIAHELKNPLTTISGAASMMARSKDDPRNAERLGMLREEVDRMRQLVEQFVTAARPIARIQPRVMRLADIAREVLLLHESVALERDVDLVIEELGQVATACDERKVKQVLINLVQNALHVSPSGSALRVRVEGRGEVAHVAVIDQGPGLAPELAGRLFMPGVTTRSDGAGLGLCLSRGLARQHGGELTLVPGPDRGCVAELTLPITSRVEAVGA